MDKKSIHELAKSILGPNTLLVDTGGWVSMRCPLATWTHEKRRDENPSAGISVHPNGTSVFSCFTCHKTGSVSWLLRKLEGYTGEEWEAMASAIERGEFYGGDIPEWGHREEEEEIHPIDYATYLGLYDSAAGHPYLRGRGIGKTAAKRMELLYDPGDNGGTKRILFPVFDRDHQLYGFSGRDITGKAKLKVKDYHGLPKKHMLLGAHLIQPDDEFVIVSEGLFDYAKMVQHEMPGTAIMCSDMTHHQAAILMDIGKPVYFFHDNDQAGIDARDRARDLLWKHLPIMKVRYPTECTVETPEGDLRPPNDPAELTKEQVMEMLEDARMM